MGMPNNFDRRRGGNFRRNSRLLQERNSLLSLVQLVIDVTLAMGSLGLIVIFSGSTTFNLYYRVLAAATALLMFIYYSRFGIYSKHTNAFGTIMKILKAWGAVVATLIFLGFVTKTSAIFSRQIIIIWISFSFILQLLAHYIFPLLLGGLRGVERRKDYAVMVGAGQLGIYLATKINKNPWLRVRVIGVVDDNQEALSNWDLPEAPPLGSINDINSIISKHNIKSIYITLPMSESATIEKLYLGLLDKNIDIYWAPDIFDMMLINHNVKELAGVPLLSLSESPLIGSHALAKSAFDRAIASVALIMLSPLMIATAIAIKLTSKGPVFFKQKRNGWDGEVFEVWKFRSMRDHKENNGAVRQATKNDPRVTTVGHFIRRTSIDELPQLFNVLLGQMSLVGPRPHALEHNNYYSKKIESYFARHRIKPGITGLAQVNGFRGETDTIGKMQKRVDYDMDYINNWSIMLDVQILFRTIFTLLSKKAY